MPQLCRVCVSADRAVLEKRLVAGEPIARIARESGISRKSLTNHRNAHLAPELAEAHEAAELERHLDLMGELEVIHTAGMALLRAAMVGELVVPTNAAGVPIGDAMPMTAADLEGDGGGRLVDGKPGDPFGVRWVRPSIALRAIRECRGTLELLARIEGDLEPEEQTIHVTFDDEWVTGQ